MKGGYKKMSMGKKAQVIDVEVLFSPHFVIFLVLGLIVFAVQLVVWRKMDFQMIWWVKLAIPIGIIFAAYFFAWRESE